MFSVQKQETINLLEIVAIFRSLEPVTNRKTALLTMLLRLASFMLVEF